MKTITLGLTWKQLDVDAFELFIGPFSAGTVARYNRKWTVRNPIVGTNCNYKTEEAAKDALESDYELMDEE